MVSVEFTGSATFLNKVGNNPVLRPVLHVIARNIPIEEYINKPKLDYDETKNGKRIVRKTSIEKLALIMTGKKPAYLDEDERLNGEVFTIFPIESTLQARFVLYNAFTMYYGVFLACGRHQSFKAFHDSFMSRLYEFLNKFSICKYDLTINPDPENAKIKVYYKAMRDD